MTASINRRAALGCLATAAAGGLLLSPRPARAAEPLEIGDEPQLFLDGWCLEHTSDVRRVLHQPTKHGPIEEADGRPWETGDCYTADGNVALRDSSGRFHMTYRYIWWDPAVRDASPNIGEDRAHWFRQTVGYATSDDGIRWSKPTLGLIEAPNGFTEQVEFPFRVPRGMSRENNLGCPIDFACDLHAHANTGDPQRRFLLRVARKDDTHPFAAVVESYLAYAAEWPDVAGDPRWEDRLERLPGAQLPPRGFRSISGFDRASGLWVAFAQDLIGNWLARGGRDVIRMTSPDLVHWNEPELVLPVADDESRTATDWIEYMFLDAYWVGGPTTGCWLGQLLIFHSDRSDPQYMMPTIANVWRKGVTELRLVTSRDGGRTWQRVADRQVWLPYHPEPHGYDRLVFAAKPIAVGDELWFYYPCWDGDHLTFHRDGSLYEPGFIRTGRTARATLRRDGYVSLRAGELPGEIVTRPLRVAGGTLQVNLNAPRGSLRAELLDEDRRPIAGYSLADCEPANGDGLEIAVRWHGADSLPALDRPVRLRLVWTGGDLYGFRFGGEA